MRSTLRVYFGLLWLSLAANAMATFHTFRIEKIYSNADGSVQYAVMHEAAGANGQEFWNGHALSSSSGGTSRVFVFPHDLPNASTAGRRVLIATQGFVALGLIEPDYVVPNGFFATGNGTLNFADVDLVSYSALPTDGVQAIDRNGKPIPNLATNYAGRSASVPAPVPVATNYQGLWWAAPAGAESGWGINFAHQSDTIFATWFTYDAAGKPWWLIALLNRTAGETFSGPVSVVTGPPFDAVPFGPPTVETQVGTMTAVFDSVSTATLAYTVNGVSQTRAITPQVFGPQPTCRWGAIDDLKLAANYTDLWWNAAEPGWGVNFTHQGNTIFATWFTYDGDGRPWWLVATLHQNAAGNYSGPVATTTGPAFGTVPFDSTKVRETEVGSATLTFANGNAGTFAYLVNGVAQAKPVARQVFAPPGTVCQ